MNIGSSQTMEEINLVIGRAISSLISSGIEVEKSSILAQLRQSEEQAVDGMKMIYAQAIRLVTEDHPRARD